MIQLDLESDKKIRLRLLMFLQIWLHLKNCDSLHQSVPNTRCSDNQQKLHVPQICIKLTFVTKRNRLKCRPANAFVSSFINALRLLMPHHAVCNCPRLEFHTRETRSVNMSDSDYLHNWHPRLQHHLLARAFVIRSIRCWELTPARNPRGLSLTNWTLFSVSAGR